MTCILESCSHWLSSSHHHCAEPSIYPSLRPKCLLTGGQIYRNAGFPATCSPCACVETVLQISAKRCAYKPTRLALRIHYEKSTYEQEHNASLRSCAPYPKAMRQSTARGYNQDAIINIGKCFHTPPSFSAINSRASKSTILLRNFDICSRCRHGDRLCPLYADHVHSKSL